MATTEPTFGQIIGGQVPTTLTASLVATLPSSQFVEDQIEYFNVGISDNAPVTITSQSYDATTDYGYLTGTVTLSCWSDLAIAQVVYLVVQGVVDQVTYVVGNLPLLSNDLNNISEGQVTINFTLGGTGAGGGS